VTDHFASFQTPLSTLPLIDEAGNSPYLYILTCTVVWQAEAYLNHVKADWTSRERCGK
jgi:hypothetical protein